MGAGDDTVTSAGLVGTGGTVAAGDGTDTIIMTSDEAEVADGSSVFNTKFTGFEVLRLSDAMDGATLDLDGVNSVDHVILAAGTDASAIFSNMSSGGRVEFVADAANDLTVNVTSAIVSASDVLNIELTGSDIDGGTVTAANVETINVIMSDGATPIAANAGALILTAAAATSVVVTGNSGVAITATGSVLVTDFDASAIIANSSAATAATYSSAAAAATTDTAAELAVTYTSVNTTANAAVSIKGGAGNDVLTGSGAAVNVDTITGGEGADTYTGGTGNDVLILTETTDAIDTVVIATTANNGTDTIKGFQAGTAGKDVVSLVDTLTDDGTASGADAVVASVAVALTNGAAVYATAVNANAQDVIEITTTLSSFGDLDKAGATTGTELLKALSSTDAAATSISTATSLADGVFIAAYQDGDAFLYQVTDDGSDNATITAAEIALVAIMEDVTAGALTSGDFVLA
jgi:S-layer protein